MTYGELQYNLITGIPVYKDITFGAMPDTVQIIEAVGFAFGCDGIARATVLWKHPEFDNNQIDIVELDALYTLETQS